MVEPNPLLKLNPPLGSGKTLPKILVRIDEDKLYS